MTTTPQPQTRSALRRLVRTDWARRVGTIGLSVASIAFGLASCGSPESDPVATDPLRRSSEAVPLAVEEPADSGLAPADELAPPVTVVADEVLSASVEAPAEEVALEDEVAPAVTVVAERGDGDEVLSATADADESCASATVGAAGVVTIVDATDTTLTIEYPQQDGPLTIYTGATTYGVALPGSNQYVIERLVEGREYTVSAVHDDEPLEQSSSDCRTTLAGPSDRPAVGALMPVGLAITAVDGTSAMLSWVAPTSGDSYVLFRGAVELGSNLPEVEAVGVVLPREQTSYLFTDLTPGEKVVVGLRTTDGRNSSSLAWVEYAVP